MSVGPGKRPPQPGPSRQALQGGLRSPCYRVNRVHVWVSRAQWQKG